MKVRIDAGAERRLWAFIRAVDTEIGGWGYATLAGGDLAWREVFLVPQEVSASEVDFEATGGDEAAVERALADRLLEDPSFVWVSWHSHHTMKPSWSKTDDARIGAMAKTGVKRLLSFVGSHDGAYKLRLDIFDVLAHDVALPQISMHDLTLESDGTDEFDVAIAREIASNVKAIPPKHVNDWWRPSDPLSPGALGGSEHELDVQEALAVRDLVEGGLSESQALLTLGELGLDGVAELLDGHSRPASTQLLLSGGAS